MKREEFLIEMINLSNLPYIWGGDGPPKNEGFDCSGLAQHLLALVKLDPPGDQSAQSLYDYFASQAKGFSVLPSQLDLGDLMFFGSSLAHISHVSIAVSNNKMFHARGGDHTCLTKADAEKKGAKSMITSTEYRKDLVATIRPRDLPWRLSPTGT